MPKGSFQRLPGVNFRYDTGPSPAETAFSFLANAAQSYANQKQQYQQQQAQLLANAFPAMVAQGMVGPGGQGGPVPGFSIGAPGTYPSAQDKLLKKKAEQYGKVTEQDKLDAITKFASARATYDLNTPITDIIRQTEEAVGFLLKTPQEREAAIEQAATRVAEQMGPRAKTDIYFIPGGTTLEDSIVTADTPQEIQEILGRGGKLLYKHKGKGKKVAPLFPVENRPEYRTMPQAFMDELTGMPERLFGPQGSMQHVPWIGGFFR